MTFTVRVAPSAVSPQILAGTGALPARVENHHRGLDYPLFKARAPTRQFGVRAAGFEPATSTV